MDKELHLIVLWEHARYQQAQIAADIQQQFRVVNCYEVEWTKSLVAANFSRFYGVNLPKNSFKEKECGSGRFLLYVVFDENPVYEERLTSRGPEVVNARLFDAKSRYRDWTRGGHKIHATNSVQETDHDLTLLLGISYDDYLQSHASTPWDGSIKFVQRDVSGAHGWESLHDFFYVFNHTVHYVVLRGEENLSPQKSAAHQDVDLLVQEWENAIFIMNGQQVWHFPPYRPKVLVTTAQDGDFLFDIWMTSLGYYPDQWYHDMFATKAFSGLYYQLSQVHAFYTRLYHCLVRKAEVAADYLPWFQERFQQLSLDRKYSQADYSDPVDMYYVALQDFMDAKGYDYTNAPEDWHCYFKSRIATIKPAWNELLLRKDLQHVVPYRVADDTTSGYVYFKAIYQGREVFIKYGGRGSTCANEIAFSQKVSAHNPTHFMTPVLCDPAGRFVAYEFVEGTPFADYLTHATAAQRSQVESQLASIAQTLTECHVMHRDLCPRNLIMVGDVLMLIDFQYAVDALHPVELDCVRADRQLALQIGENYRYRTFVWNDAKSLAKIQEEFGLHVQTPASFDKSFRMPWKLILITICRAQARKLLSCIKPAKQ